jgi:allantoinase
MHLTPYIMGLPYRIDAFEALVRWLAEQPGAWFATGSEILDSWSAST